MDPITQQTVLAAAGAGGGDPVYVDDVFSTYLVNGTSAIQTVNNGIDLAGEGGMVWSKTRKRVYVHAIHDTERGINRPLDSYSTGPAQDRNTDSTQHTINSFNSNGFTLGADQTSGAVNYAWNTTPEYVHWTFRKAPGFFDVVTYTGNGVSGRTIAHNLGSVPGMIIVKRTDSTGNWAVYHRSTGNSNVMYLHTTGAASASPSFNNTTPTSTEFTVNNGGAVNGSGGTYVAYVFAHDDAQFGTGGDESIIKCGSYTGGGSGSPTTVNLGFEPQWVLIKNTDLASDWMLFDNMRGITTGGLDNYLSPNLNNAEADGGLDQINLTSTGFEAVRNSYEINASGYEYIYMAIRRPHKPPEAGADVVFKALHRTGTGSASSVTGFGFPPDLVIAKRTDATGTGAEVFDKMRGRSGLLNTAETAAETNYSSVTQDLASFDQDGLSFGTGAFSQINYTSRNIALWNFKRAPGFMDVVAYSGGGSTTKNHNLAAVPELMIVKARNVAGQWYTYSAATGTSKYIKINSDAAATTGVTWGVTSSNFTVFAGANDSNETYITYLFATLPGISKVGSYTGTGNAINVDCGFTNGARFVLIKRADDVGDWYLFDTTRGINVGDEPRLKLNTTDAQSSSDRIDPYSSGFTVNASVFTHFNALGGNYIFLAIA